MFATQGTIKSSVFLLFSPGESGIVDTPTATDLKLNSDCAGPLILYFICNKKKQYYSNLFTKI